MCFRRQQVVIGDDCAHVGRRAVYVEGVGGERRFAVAHGVGGAGLEGVGSFAAKVGGVKGGTPGCPLL